MFLEAAVVKILPRAGYSEGIETINDIRQAFGIVWLFQYCFLRICPSLYNVKFSVQRCDASLHC